MRFFRDRYGDLTFLSWTLIIISVCLIAVIVPIIIINVNLLEGVETTVTGTVQLHVLRYNKFLGMEHTDVEMRTFSGDTHHVSLLGHITDIEYGKAYMIRYRAVDWWGHLILGNQLLELRLVDVEVP